MNINKLFRRLSIRVKLTVAFALLALLPLTIMGTVGFWITTDSLQDNAVSQVRHYVDLVKIDVSNLLDRTRLDLEYLEQLDGFAKFSLTMSADQTQTLSKAIQLFCESHPVYFQIKFLSPDGRELLRVVDLGGEYGSLSARDELSGARFYLHALQETRGEQIVAVPVELKHPLAPDKYVAAVSFIRVSVSRSGEPRGIWVADLYAERLIDLLRRPPIVSGGELVFCDSQGHYLYHPAKKKEWHQLLATRSIDNLFQEWEPRVARAILSGQDGVITGGGRDIIAHSSVWTDPSDPGRGYVIYYRIPAGIALAPARHFVWVFILLGILTMMLVAGAAYLGAGQLTRPLLALSRGAQVIAAGNFEHRITVATNDELETLADDFNRMAASMAERDRLISEHKTRLNEYAESLEAMVDARTAELRDSHKLLARTEKMAAVGKLAAGIAHEINNPIGIILNRIETMSAEHTNDMNEGLRSDFAVLSRHAKRIGSITENLLHFARPRSLSRQSVDLQTACRSVVALINPEYERRGVRLDVTQPEEPVCVFGDPDRLEQIVLNLLDNALDVSAAGQTVKLHLERSAETAIIEIRDGGCGIPLDDIERIFDPFFTTKQVGQGSGLGLTITDELVRDHGGQIQVKSVVGTGTVFLVEIPLHE
jgi:two-component system NtrC family sensor kinase